MTVEEKQSLAEWRKTLKKYHFCKDCGKQDAYTLGGRTYCFECAEKGAMYKRIAREIPEKKQKMSEQHKSMRDKRKAQHQCPTCGRKLSENYEYVHCVYCRERQKKYNKTHRHKKYGIPNIRGENDICWQCNKNTVKQGFKLCEECYTKKVKIAKENLKKVNMEVHPWRELNKSSLKKE